MNALENFIEPYNLNMATLEDCITNHNMKGMCAICSDGRLEGFIHEDVETEQAV